jgi:hypothetical protein
MNQYYYNTSTEQTYSAAQMLGLFGINVETTDTSILNLNGFYPVIETQPDFDVQLYSRTVSYTIVGTDALMVWTPAPLPLPTAIANGSSEEIAKANTQEANIVAQSQLSTDLLTAVTGQEPIDRPARFQDVLDAMGAVSNNLDSNLTAIEAATSVDEINNIVNPPGGVLFTGRGAGLGPQDLNVSYYTAFNSVSMAESETELYVPSTDTVIPYGSGGPGQFDSMGNCFDPEGPYVIQIRESATSMVIAEITVPLAPAGVDVAF